MRNGVGREGLPMLPPQKVVVVCPQMSPVVVLTTDSAHLTPFNSILHKTIIFA